MLTLKPEQVLFSQGEPITGLFLIISGSFSLTFPGGEYTLSGGDVLVGHLSDVVAELP